jgi:glutathione S-transferase
MTVRIYGSIGSRASRCLWVAEETGVDFDWVSISTLDGSNRSPEYLAINPSGKIPAMKDGELVLTESFAINQYLAERYGAGTIWPADMAHRGLAHQWTFWSATEVERYITELFPHFVMLPPEERDPEKIARLVPELMEKLAQLDEALKGRDYLLGDFSLADINLAVQSFTFVDRFMLSLHALPNVEAWTTRCRARPGRQKVEERVAAAAR